MLATKRMSSMKDVVLPTRKGLAAHIAIERSAIGINKNHRPSLFTMKVSEEVFEKIKQEIKQKVNGIGDQIDKVQRVPLQLRPNDQLPLCIIEK